MKMREKTAVFIGHAHCSRLDSALLEDAVEGLVLRGVDLFLCGGMGEFDRRGALAVWRVKMKYPYIRCCLVLPYLTFTYDSSAYDETIYPEGMERYYFKAAIPARNRYMVSQAQNAICYIRHNDGGAARTYAYAKKQGVQLIEL